MAKKKAKPKPRYKTVTLKQAPRGTYDVGLDIQERAGQRGLADLLYDVNTQGTYAASDFQLGLGDIDRQRRELGEDVETQRQSIERGYGQSMEDLLSQEQGVVRGYQQLAGRQAQTGRAAGVQAGGFAAQAAQKRATNQAIDIAPINVARARTTEQRQLSLNDLLRQQQRGGESLDRSVGELARPYTREGEARGIQALRAQREQTAFSSDLDTIRMQQYLEGGGLRKRRLNLAKPKQRRMYRQWKKSGVI